MTERVIGVWSGRGDLAPALRARLPWTFADAGAERETARVAIVDSDSHDEHLLRTSGSAIRVLLHDGRAGERHATDLWARRDWFLSDPQPLLDAAFGLADAASQNAQLEQQVGYLTQIHDLMALTDAAAVSERITRTVLNILGLRNATLYLHDPRAERYVPSFTTEEQPVDTGEFLPGVPAALLQAALASGRRFAVERTGRGGLIVMPVQVGDDLLAVIRVAIAPGEGYDERVVPEVSDYLDAVSQVVANIYQLTRSQELAMRDDLTKAFNRRFFESYLDEEIERSRRYGATFSIIFLDLDDLKMVNNAYGHLAGSRTLQEVAKRILNAVRGIDKVVRFGGDEFCVILPQTDPEQAMAVANRIRRSMTSAPFRLEGTADLPITASFGIATYPMHAVTKEGLIRQADAAMYRVKSTTKNAVGIATVEDATKPLAT